MGSRVCRPCLDIRKKYDDSERFCSLRHAPDPTPPVCGAAQRSAAQRSACHHIGWSVRLGNRGRAANGLLASVYQLALVSLAQSESVTLDRSITLSYTQSRRKPLCPQRQSTGSGSTGEYLRHARDRVFVVRRLRLVFGDKCLFAYVVPV
jgi:hypothetical protein